jgi:aminoglycoside phosphotransferase (APT) family kinase protein
MSIFERVKDFIEANAWQLLAYNDLGTTAHVFVVARAGQKRVLKTQRDDVTTACSLRAEYEVLRYLNGTDMARYVPAVGAWVDEIHGFMMEHLRYPTPEEGKEPAFMRALALALRTLHSVDPAPLEGLDDDRPFIGAAISGRLREAFEAVTRDDSSWAGLGPQDRARLELVRARYQTYVQLLPVLETALKGVPGALTHGDLAGDNVMVRSDGSLALTDWGAARISAGLTDVARLLVYAGWEKDAALQFLRAYFDPDDMPPVLETLRRVYQYNSCVWSLRALNEPGDEGLDAVGRAHFERQLEAL